MRLDSRTLVLSMNKSPAVYCLGILRAKAKDDDVAIEIGRDANGAWRIDLLNQGRRS